MAGKQNRQKSAGLTLNQERFVQLLIEGKSQRQAYREAYPNCGGSDEVVDVKASKLFAEAKVRLRHEELQAKVLEPLEEQAIATAREVLLELTNIARANGTDFARVVDGHVEIVDTETLPVEKRAAIAGIKQTLQGVEVKTYDKVKALELLGKAHRLFSENVNLGGSVSLVSETDAKKALEALGYVKPE